MRTSILSRSAIAVASLAIGSVALAAAPATAATSSGVTRDQVLAAASAARVIISEESFIAAVELVEPIARRACKVASGDSVEPYFRPALGGTNPSADGILVRAVITHSVGSDITVRECAFVALASADGAATLTGRLSLTGSTTDDDYETIIPVEPVAATLSGDVFVSDAITSVGDSEIADAVFTSTGATTKTVPTTTTVKVKINASKAVKKAEKKKYVKRLAQARKNYVKALHKAAGSKNKKAAAKRVYAMARALAKAKYAAATVTYRDETRPAAAVVSAPFALSADLSS